jgi:NAD+ kinase
MRKNDEMNKASKPPTNLLVLNEVVIDRGPSPYLSNIDLFLDGKHITSVQGDGKSLHQCELTEESYIFA